jgi:hypothetical protein
MARAIWEGLVKGGDEPAVLTTDGTKLSEVIGRLERYQEAKPVMRELGLDAAGMVGVMACAALGDGVRDVGPPLVRSHERYGYPAAMREVSLTALFPSAPRPSLLALSAGLLQIHDFWDESHKAAQEADDLGERLVSAYWHGIAHRREPDAGNAAYWFRRVGRHPVFRPLAEAARAVIDDPEIAAKLLPRGAWDPYAFIDFCGSANSGAVPLARKLQRVEMILLLEASLPGGAPRA